MTLARGDRVVDPTNPRAVAVIVGGPEIVAGTRFYAVQTADGEEMLFAERDLKKQAVDPNDPVAWLAGRPLVDPDHLARYLTSLKLSSRLTDVVYSFSSTRTLFRVHQFKPVLKIIQSDSHRM